MKKKNVIWVLGDQHRAQAMSCAGDPNVNTPHMDISARNGLLFPNAVAGFPLCCPFRGSMLSGRYPHHCVPGHDFRLPAGQKTVADAFNGNGYETAWFGKWHVAGQFEGFLGGEIVRHEESYFTDRLRDEGQRECFKRVPSELRGGFKTWIGYENNNSPWNCWVHGHRGSEEVTHNRLNGFETDALTDLLIDYLKERSQDDAPFFAALSVQPPHDPYAGPAEHHHNPQDITLRPNVPAALAEKAREGLAGYYAMIENLDDNIGRIRQALTELGLDTDTHIVFFSDHGDSHGSNGMQTKMNPYEESLRIPFIISGTHEFQSPSGSWGKKDRRVPAVINHVDIAPTSLGLCGLAVPDWMEGWDYSHYRVEGGAPREGEPDSAYIQQVFPTGHPNSLEKPWRGVVTRDGWKYVCIPDADWLLFNLNTDPYEQNNLVHNTLYASKRTELKAMLLDWIEKTGDAFAVPPEAVYDTSMHFSQTL